MIHYAIALTLRVLLFWGYHSTDFEVHRNWMAITHNLPLQNWYHENTSEWTLDYPPFFAYFEYILSQGARLIDPNMLKITADPYENENCIGYQRFTVILSETVLVFSLFLYSNNLLTALVLLNPGLIYVDCNNYKDIHFQYNGMLIGLTLLSIHLINKKKFIQSAVIYSILLLFKHIYLYYVFFIQAPAYFLFFLKHFCMHKKKISLKNLFFSGFTVITIFAIGLLPFWPEKNALFSRLFPWGRGLTHSYWAPNLWSLYNFTDSILSFLIKKSFKTEYTLGLVQICNHSILPNITPFITFVVLAVFMSFLCVVVWKSQENMFCECLCWSALGFFLVGWHVHEKAVLMISIPLL